MRATLSLRLGRPGGEGRATQAGSGLGALALIAVLLSTAGVVAPTKNTRGAERISTRSRAGSAAAVPAPTPPRLFRIVGCRDSAPARAYRGGPSRRRVVALGFDDGPGPETPAFVRMLERAHARATFFLIGRQVSAAFRPLLLRELRDGDVLGDHSYSHPDLATRVDVRGQLASTAAAIRAQTGYTPCVFRPPYGDYDATVVAVAHALGMATVLWNVDPTDWARPGTAAIEQRVLAQVRPGSIVLSHDGGGPRGQTLAAYPGIVAGLRARGYRIVTIPELLGLRPVYVPCVRLCEGIGVAAGALPRNAVLESPRLATPSPRPTLRPPRHHESPANARLSMLPLDKTHAMSARAVGR